MHRGIPYGPNWREEYKEKFGLSYDYDKRPKSVGTPRSAEWRKQDREDAYQREVDAEIYQNMGINLDAFYEKIHFVLMRGDGSEFWKSVNRTLLRR